jgi:hypothetical protein
VSPNPAPLLPGTLGRSPKTRVVLAGTVPLPLAALPPPLHRNHRPPLPSALAAPEPPVEVENLCRGAQSGPEQRLRRQQRDTMAGGAVDLDEVAQSKRGVSAVKS